MKGCTPKDYLARLQRLARERGGKLLSRAYVNDRTKLRFRCAEGHEWTQAPGAVQQGKWCSRCAIDRRAAGRKIPAIARLNRLVALRGGTIISPFYINSQTKLRYRCGEGHKWDAVPNSILTGRWCPVCARQGRSKARKRAVFQRLQRIVKSRDGEILAPEFVHSHAKLRLRCPRGHIWQAVAASIDAGVSCPSCKSEAWMGVLRDCAERWGGECLSRSCSSGYDRLILRCAAGHRFERTGNEIKRGQWCPKCRQPGHGDLKRMHRIARERHGACLSKQYVDAGTALRWRCRHGHEWEAAPGTIVQGTWCPICRRRGGHSLAPLSIEIMREMASERGGACLSAVYQGNRGRLRWRCARGHEWMAFVKRVRQGAWCPVCSHSARGTIDGMRALAVERGGRCLTRTWDNHRQPLLFECGRGHRFRARANVVKTGVWCPTCPGRTRVR